MTLLIATPWPLRSPGGGQQLALGIADALAAQGIDVIVGAGSGLTERTYDVIGDGRFREARLRLTGHAAGWVLRRKNAVEFYLEGLDALARSVRPHALLFTPHYSSCAVQARAVAEASGIPFLLCPAIHLDHDHHTSADARRFYRSADRILCLSANEREWLHTTVGIPLDRLLTPGYPWRGPVNAPSGRTADGSARRLLGVGAFVRHKRFEDQIDAVEVLRREHKAEVHLTLAGTGGASTVAGDLARLVQRRSLESRIEIVVDATDAAVARLYETADAFLFTSRSESFGVAVLEAIARGTPPVVYPHPVYRTHVEGSGFGRVAAASTPEALADAVVSATSTTWVETDRASWLAKHSPARVGAALAAMMEQLEAERPVERT